ncbi:MAG: CDP-diacylglycerol--glycerol-3-phosphate 3-phosphatidyltransferase [Clostridiales bacterium]|nr:CDP-diacylglycerol--glycerol-3-phosphate 3-phosphatidyltransferase [Clostridiales bacterium]
MNLPNKISLTRIFMIPVFVVTFFLEGILPYNFLISAVIFALAAFTDFIDGKIARSRGLVTNLGKFLDPIADKVLVSTAMVLLLTMRRSLFGRFDCGVQAPLYVATVVCVCIILARELIISAFRQIAATNGIVMAAEKLGKYKTACQDVAIFILLLSADISTPASYAVPWGVYVAWFGVVLFFLATVLTIWSGIAYVVKNKQVLKDKKD